MSAFGTLLRHQWRKHRVVAVLVPLAVFAFQWLVTRIAPTPAQTRQMGEMLALLPPQVIAALGMSSPQDISTIGVLMFAYTHPFVILLMGMWTVRVCAGGLAGEIGAGTMDLVASRPVGRSLVVLSVAVTAAAGIALASIMAVLGTALGLATRDLGNVGVGQFVPVAGGLALLFAAWAGIALFVAGLSRQGGPAMALLAGLMAGTFALDYIAKVWTPIKPLRHLSPFMYFEPHAIQGHHLANGGPEVLTALAVGGLLAALLAFRLRDL